MQLPGSVSGPACPPLHLSCSYEHPVDTKQESTGALSSAKVNSKHILLGLNSIPNGGGCSEQSQCQLERPPINQRANLPSCYHLELQCFISAHEKFQTPVERCLAGLSKASQASFCFPVGWRDATGSGKQLALTGGSPESDGPAGIQESR